MISLYVYCFRRRKTSKSDLLKKVKRNMEEASVMPLPPILRLQPRDQNDIKSAYVTTAAILVGNPSDQNWFKQRAGRITASKLKAACRTKLHKPSSSLINSICYPEANKIYNAATSWGLNNEAQARACYAE
jgi:hypothetical protein